MPGRAAQRPKVSRGAQTMTEKTNLQALGSTAVLGALPCPFCGSTQIGFADGSTFRWLVAVCENCGAQAEEVRIDTLMPCRAAAEANAKVDALKAWNTRAPNK